MVGKLRSALFDFERKFYSVQGKQQSKTFIGTYLVCVTIKWLTSSNDDVCQRIVEEKSRITLSLICLLVYKLFLDLQVFLADLLSNLPNQGVYKLSIFECLFKAKVFEKASTSDF